MRDDPSSDLLTLPGMLHCASLCFQLKPGGLAHFGPECSSFIWMSRGTNGRSDADIHGLPPAAAL
eukprot:541144-Pyramimonas_sp.AAC.1